MTLTDQQLRYFDTFGFLSFPGLFAEEAERITNAFEQVWASHGGGHHGREHDRQRRSALVPFIDQDEYLSSLLDDPRIEGIGSSILGDDFNYTASDGNFYVGDTSWHSDGYKQKKYLSLKMAFYLDPVTRDTGCLRVIPGIHRVGDKFAESFQEAAPNSRTSRFSNLWGIEGSEVPAVALECRPGDLLVFNHNTKHASFGGGDPRRMFTINLQQRYAEEDLPELREQIAGMARFWMETPYGEAMLSTASASPLRHLEQWLANAADLPELVRKAKEEKAEPRHVRVEDGAAQAREQQGLAVSSTALFPHAYRRRLSGNRVVLPTGTVRFHALSRRDQSTVRTIETPFVALCHT